MKLVLLWTDAVMWLLFATLLGYAFYVRRSPTLRSSWQRVFQDRAALASSVIVGLCLLVTLADSVHFRRALPPSAEAPNAAVAYEVTTRSLLDAGLERLIVSREATYSLPLAYLGFIKESADEGGQLVRTAPRLAFGGRHLDKPEQQWLGDVLARAAGGLALGGALACLLVAGLAGLLARGLNAGLAATWASVWRDETPVPWRTGFITLFVLGPLIGAALMLSGPYHLLGTDRTGNDVFYQALKSLRTAFVIGTLATVATLPLAVVFGIMAGYFRGWVDELIQYFYTVLSSVPNVLLIAACVLMVQGYLDRHPEMFETGAERADLKLFLLCAILGVTGWASLCRLLRGETLKLRELEYVQAAQAFGVGPARIMARHVFPNVAHLMLISTVLDFSSLILYEAVLTYVGVGVDPTMNSFGGMINLARAEMGRDPVIWWSFAAAFGFMVALVLAANLLADGVRDAFDPRARVFRPTRILKP